MTTYLYRCRTCGATRESISREDIQPCACGGISRRDYTTIQFGAVGLTPHFNHAVGAFVSSNRDFDDKLKRASERNTLATGAEHNYVRIDPGEMTRPTTDTEAFETRAKATRDAIQK